MPDSPRQTRPLALLQLDICNNNTGCSRPIRTGSPSLTHCVTVSHWRSISHSLRHRFSLPLHLSTHCLTISAHTASPSQHTLPDCFTHCVTISAHSLSSTASPSHTTASERCCERHLPVALASTSRSCPSVDWGSQPTCTGTIGQCTGTTVSTQELTVSVQDQLLGRQELLVNA